MDSAGQNDDAWAQAYAPSPFVRFTPTDAPAGLEFVLLNAQLAQGPRNLDLATFRPARHGGATPEDLVVQQNIFLLVGAITVAGGLVEAEMKRLLLLDSEDTDFVQVDENWTELERRLAQVSASESPHAEAIRQALEWAERNGIKRARDSAVHSAWWLFNVGGGVARARFRRGMSGALELGTIEDYLEQANLVFEYAERLAEIGSWPMAVLPPGQMMHLELRWSDSRLMPGIP